MKKLFLLLLAVPLLYVVYVAVTVFMLPPVSSLQDTKKSFRIDVKDWHGERQQLLVGPENRHWARLSQIPLEMQWAVILSEDANFYHHEGLDMKAIREAIKYDLEKKRLARGASTITQQAAKNLFLYRDKTITRKLKEVYLAKRMEQVLTKGRILELYLNVVELGPMVYGVGHGARYYFGKPPQALTPREAAFLAAMLPGPRVAYNPYRNLNRVLKRSDHILRQLVNQGIISKAVYQAALASHPNIAGMQRKVEKSLQEELLEELIAPEPESSEEGAESQIEPAKTAEPMEPTSRSSEEMPESEPLPESDLQEGE